MEKFILGSGAILSLNGVEIEVTGVDSIPIHNVEGNFKTDIVHKNLICGCGNVTFELVNDISTCSLCRRKVTKGLEKYSRRIYK